MSVLTIISKTVNFCSMLLKVLKKCLPVIAALGILIFSLIPNPPELMNSFKFMDKVEHFIAYFVLAFIFYLSFSDKKINAIKIILLNTLICSLYGAVIEVLQSYTGRTMDINDFFADFMGSLMGSLFCFLFISLWRKLFAKKYSNGQ